MLPFLKIDLIIGLPTILKNNLVNKMLASLDSSELDSLASITGGKQSRADRHRGTIPSGDIGSSPRFCSYCVHPSPQATERESRKTQRALQEEESRLRNKPTVDAITAWHAVLTQQIEQQRALIDETEKKLRERVSS